jgi:predicted dehydrogenase
VQVIRATAAGKSALVEKPFTLGVADARSAIEAAEHAGVVLAVGFDRRFHPSMVRLRQIVRGAGLAPSAPCSPSKARCTDCS